MKSLCKLVKELLFPPRCAACGKLMHPSPSLAEHALCPACHKIWERELRTQCSTCFLEYCTCRCVPVGLKKQGIEQYVKLAPYGDEKNFTVTRRIVLGMKEHVKDRTLRLLAKELALTAQAAIAASERVRQKNGCKEPLETVVTYLPRGKRGVRRTGVDQARELARALSAETGYRFVPLLGRVRDGLPQKSLSRRERALNLRGAFERIADAGQYRVLLVDDVVTTGAGMSECARVLEAAEIIAVSVAFTEKKQIK